MRHYPGEDLDIYLRRFHDQALDCNNPVDEEVLISVCLHGMMEYHIFREESLVAIIFRLMEAARRTMSQ